VPACCGREHQSAYCPSCGARLAPPLPLDGLLAHCRQQARILEALVAEWEEPGLPMTEARQAMQARDRARLAKWSAWADGLAALLAGDGSDLAGHRQGPAT
jgi:hypothetical protein